MNSATNEHRRRRMLIGVLAGAVIVCVLLYRFNTLGGALGGFDDDHFIALARANQLLAGEWPLRDYPDASLQGAWPPLAYLPSAAAQVLFGRTLLAEGIFVASAVAVSAGLTFLAAVRLGVPYVLGAATAFISVMPSVKLYGWARPVLFAVAALLIHRYADRPTLRRLAALSLLLAAAFLVRHDYAVYLGAGVGVALLARHRSEPAVALTRGLAWAGLIGLLLLPTIILVQWLVGWGPYLAAINALTADERVRTYLYWPKFDWSSLWAEANQLAWLYYLFFVLPLLAPCIAIWRARRGADAAELPAVFGIAATALVANHFLLRGNLGARLADPAVLHALLGMWLLALAWHRPWRPILVRGPVAALATVVALVSVAGLAEVGSVSHELATARFDDSPVAVIKTTMRVGDQLKAQPPTRWDEPYPKDGVMLAAAYLHECTSPEDRVFNARYGVEALVFGRKLFGAGQANFVPGHYASEREQQQAVDRASRQSIPIVFMEPHEISQGFGKDFPIVDAFLRERYEEAGTIPTGDNVYARVFTRRGLEPARTFGDTGLPCFR